MTIFGRIEICGGIASGKTTLARVLQQAGCNATFEDFKNNPFWKLFYFDPGQFAFETEITFLLQHFNQIRIAGDLNEPLVCDFSLLLDLGYADINLDGSRYAAFSTVLEEVRRTLPEPALVVHLICSAEEELKRIRARKRAEENRIEIKFLEALNAAVTRRVSETTISVCEINSEQTNFASDDATQKRVAEKIFQAIR